MKKNNLFLLGLTSLLTLASLAACGNKNDPSSVGPSSQDTSVTSSADPSSESQSVAPSSSEAPSSSQAPSSSEAPSSSQASSSSQAPSSSIEVSSMAPIPDYFRVNAPEVLVVGQTVNLDNYVTHIALRQLNANGAPIFETKGGAAAIIDQANPALESLLSQKDIKAGMELIYGTAVQVLGVKYVIDGMELDPAAKVREIVRGNDYLIKFAVESQIRAQVAAVVGEQIAAAMTVEQVLIAGMNALSQQAGGPEITTYEQARDLLLSQNGETFAQLRQIMIVSNILETGKILTEELGLIDIVDYYLYKHNDHYYLSLVPLIDLKNNVIRYSVYVGDIVNKRFEPSHCLYRSNNLSRKFKYRYDLDDNEYKKFISGNELTIKKDSHYYLVTYKGYSLGYGKCSNGQLKNKYPKGLRLN